MWQRNQNGDPPTRVLRCHLGQPFMEEMRNQGRRSLSSFVAELEFNRLPASESSALVWLPLCCVSEFSSPDFSESKSFPAWESVSAEAPIVVPPSTLNLRCRQAGPWQIIRSLFLAFGSGLTAVYLQGGCKVARGGALLEHAACLCPSETPIPSPCHRALGSHLSWGMPGDAGATQGALGCPG